MTLLSAGLKSERHNEMRKIAFKISIFILLSALCLTRSTAQNTHDIDSLVKVVATMPDDTSKLTVLNLICSMHPNADSVYKYAEDMLNLAKAEHSGQWEARAYHLQAWYFYNTNELEKSLEYNYKSLRINDSLGLRYEVAMSYAAAGECLNELGDRQTANEYYNIALDILSEIGNTSASSQILRDLGIMSITTKLYNNARRYIYDALKIDVQENKTHDILIDHHYLGYINCLEYETTKNTLTILDARRHSDAAYRLALKLENDYYICHTAQSQMQVYLNYAGILDEQMRTVMLDSSLYFYDTAVELAKKLGYYDGYYYVIELWKVKYLLATKSVKKSLELLRTIEKKAENDSETIAFADIYGLYTQCYTAMGNYPKALEYKKKQILRENIDNDLDFTLSSVRVNAKENFERNMRQHQLDEEREAIIYNLHKRHMRIVSGIIFGFLLVISIFAIIIFRNWKREHRTNMVLMQQNKKFIEQRNKLADINYQITSSLTYARGIQTAIMPSPETVNTIFGNSLIIWNPMEIVSGDFYWVAQVGQYKLIAAADCTGFGVQGAFMSILGMTALNDITADENFKIGDNSAAEILNMLRAKTIESLNQQDKYQKELKPEGMHIALCILDTKTNNMQYAGAYRPLIIARRDGLIIYQPDRMIIGYQPGKNDSFTNNTIKLSEDDTIYMYTNGIAEQLNSDKKGVKFTSIRLNNLIEANYTKPFAEQRQIIEDTIKKWRTESGNISEQTDDQLLIGFRID